MAFDTIQTPAGKAESVLGGSVNYFSIAASFYAPIEIVVCCWRGLSENAPRLVEHA